jgi:hypothetical protein
VGGKVRGVVDSWRGLSPEDLEPLVQRIADTLITP